MDLSLSVFNRLKQSLLLHLTKAFFPDKFLCSNVLSNYHFPFTICCVTLLGRIHRVSESTRVAKEICPGY